MISSFYFVMISLQFFFYYFVGDLVPKMEEKIDTPVFHCHGDDDQMISIYRGKKTSEVLQKLVKNYEFHNFPYMGHEATEEEMNLLSEFIAKQLPPKANL